MKINNTGELRWYEELFFKIFDKIFIWLDKQEAKK